MRRKSELIFARVRPVADTVGVSVQTNGLREIIDLITDKFASNLEPTNPKENSAGKPSAIRTIWAFRNELGNKAWEVIT